MTSRTGDRSGLTLIEILISVAILASASVLIMQALLRGAYMLESAKRRTTAYAFAAAKLADVELALLSGEELKTGGQFWAGREAFRWAVAMEPAPDEPDDLQLVTLTVNWRQGRHPYRETYSTIVPIPKEEP